LKEVILHLIFKVHVIAIAFTWFAKGLSKKAASGSCAKSCEYQNCLLFITIYLVRGVLTRWAPVFTSTDCSKHQYPSVNDIGQSMLARSAIDSSTAHLFFIMTSKCGSTCSMPVVIAYTISIYWVFHGKVELTDDSPVCAQSWLLLAWKNTFWELQYTF
jgi:cytochrome bd-type quinol oxidase subunit 2